MSGPSPGRYNAAKLVLALRQVGITDRRLSDIVEKTSREPFISPPFADSAWDNVELPIECGQTQTRPVTVAAMIEALEIQKDSVVLEVGTGSGYAAALMARFARRIYSVDRYRTLVARAQRSLDQLGVSRVHVSLADGRHGLKEFAPYDRILLMGAVDQLPAPIIAQLGVGGIIVAPIDGPDGQNVVRFDRLRDGTLASKVLFPSRFLPLEDGVAREL